MRKPLVPIPLFLLLLCLSASAQTSTPATTRASFPITFLDLDAARAAIIDDALDPYFEKLSPAEMSAKTSKPITGDTPAAQLAECKKRYQIACRVFRSEEQKGMQVVLAKIQPLLQRHYPRFANEPWSFIKVSDQLEGGMPHTRGRHIVIPENFARAAARIGEDSGDSVFAHFGGVLVHEKMHIVQRAHPDWFTQLYTDVLGFTRATKIDSLPAIEDRRVVNPDGTVCDWVYPLNEAGAKRWIWPRLVLKNTDQPSLRIDALAVDLVETGEKSFKVKVENGEPVTQPLLAVQPYMAAMRAGFNSYHPNEVSAEVFARMFVAENLSPGQPDAGLNQFRDWAKQTFNP